MEVSNAFTQVNGYVGSEAVHKDIKLQEVAKSLEASFLSEMLKNAGVGKVSQEWGGGPGEEHFSSFLVDIQAENMVERGGIGLAEEIYKELKGREK